MPKTERMIRETLSQETLPQTSLPLPAETVKPKLILPVGRGSHGKSLFARWLIDQLQMKGEEIVVADADRTNPSLAAYFEGVLTPSNADQTDTIAWFAQLCERQIAERCSVLIDFGGGDLLLKEAAARIKLVTFLEKYEIETVAIHLIGPDIDDLAYLRDLEKDRLLAPRKTLLVFNEGLVLSRRSLAEAFQPVLDHKILQDTVNRGAKMAWMPRLDMASDIDLRRLTFSAAEAGATRAGLPPLGPWNRQLITQWLAAMQENFAPVMSWLMQKEIGA